MECPCNISRAVQVLPARVDQMNHVSCNEKRRSFFRFVMNDCCVWTSCACCDKARRLEKLIFGSHFIHVKSTIPFSDRLLLRSPCPESCHRNTISYVGFFKSLNLFLVPDSSVKANTFRPFDRIDKFGENVMINNRLLNKGLFIKLWWVIFNINSDFFQVTSDFGTFK